MAVFDNSRYLHTTLNSRIGFESPIFTIRKRFSFSEDNCTIYEWIDGDTLDGVAFKHYGESDLRWAILDANPRYKTEFDIECGDEILIPNYDEVVNLVNGD